MRLFEHYISICSEEATEVMLELSALKNDVQPHREVINRISTEFTELFATFNELLSVVKESLEQDHSDEIDHYNHHYVDPHLDSLGYSFPEWHGEIQDLLLHLQQTMMKSLRFGLGNRYKEQPTNLQAALTLMTKACHLMNYFEQRVNTKGVLYCTVIQEKKLARINKFFAQSVKNGCLLIDEMPSLDKPILKQGSSQNMVPE